MGGARLPVEKKVLMDHVRTQDVVPERGIELQVVHGSLIYGPWEDRQRAWLQGFFTPPDFETRQVHMHKAGYTTQRSAFRTKISLRGSVRLHVPFSRDCSGRENDFTCSRTRGEGCGNFLQLTSGTPFYQHVSYSSNYKRRHDAGLREGSFEPDSGRGRNAASLPGRPARVAEGPGGRGRDANASASALSPSSRERGPRADGEGQGGEGEGTDSDSEYTDDSADSYETLDEEEEEEEEAEEEDWSEIIARSGIEGLQVVGTIENLVPWLMKSDGSKITTDVVIDAGVRIASDIPSAVEDGVFWRSEELRVSVKMKSGLAFHDPTSTEWEVEASRSEVRMLRDHTRLITAVLADWGWRPNLKHFTEPVENALYFVPSTMGFKLRLVDGFKLGLLVNDDNVVDDHGDDSANSILWLGASTLEVKTYSRTRTFQPNFGLTEYVVHVPNLTGWLQEKAVSGINLRAAGPFPDCLSAAALDMRGSFTGWRPSNKVDPPLDTSSVSIEFTQLTLLGHGYVLGALMSFIRNYFGVTSCAISRSEFEATVRSDSEKAKCSPDRAIPGWNRKLHVLNAFNATKKQVVRTAAACEQVVRVSASDVVVELPEHHSMTAARRLCAYAICREVLFELRTMPDMSQMLVHTSSITLDCVRPIAGAMASASERANGTKRSTSAAPPFPQAGSRGGVRPAGVIIIDRVEYSVDSCLGPLPDYEAYKNSTRLTVGCVEGDMSPSHVLPLLGAFSQLLSFGDPLPNGDTSHLPGRLWMPSLAHNTLEASLAPVRLTLSAPSLVADLSLAKGLSIKGSNLICSAHSSITSVSVPVVSASLHQRKTEGLPRGDAEGGSPARGPSAQESGDEARRDMAAGDEDGRREEGVGEKAGPGEEVLEVARVETNLKVSLMSHSSNWERESLEQYRYVLFHDRGTARHGFYQFSQEEGEVYLDAEEATKSQSSPRSSNPLSEEVFLTADDFVTSDDLSSGHDSSDDLDSTYGA
jgi:hypothetical protein